MDYFLPGDRFQILWIDWYTLVNPQYSRTPKVATNDKVWVTVRKLYLAGDDLDLVYVCDVQGADNDKEFALRHSRLIDCCDRAIAANYPPQSVTDPKT